MNCVCLYLAWNAKALYLTERHTGENVFDRPASGGTSEHKQRWAGQSCCFVLFIAALPLSGDAQSRRFSGCWYLQSACYFSSSGAVASFFSQRREVCKPSFGAMLAYLFNVIMRLFFFTDALILARAGMVTSVVFWCALGALVFSYLSVVCLNHSTENYKAPNARACQTITFEDFFSTHAANRIAA
ncbi:inner membrane protein YbjM [Shigella flexneri]